MQSINRAIKRGNAAAYIVSELEGIKIKWKKHSTKDSWNYAVKNSVSEFYLKKHEKCI